MTIKSTLAEVEQVFIQLELTQASTVCLTSDIPKAGVTSLSMALVERYLLAGYRTLLVDFNTFNPCFNLVPIYGETSLIQHGETNQLFTGLIAPASCQAQLPYRTPASLGNEIENWLSDYDRIVFDTSPVLQCNRSNIPTTVVAGQCHATLLIANGGHSQKDGIAHSVELLKATKANVIGVILNHHNQETFDESLQHARGFSVSLVKFFTRTLERFISYPLFRHPV